MKKNVFKSLTKIVILVFIAGWLSIEHSHAQTPAETSEYYSTVTFPAGYAIGDYVEFLRVQPLNVWSSGYYEISISYTRTDMAAAATHLASISHSNPTLWREVGRINSNGYISSGAHNFTIDCNSQYGNPRFRVRAIQTLGHAGSPITVHVKVRSINRNASWTALQVTGNDTTVDRFLPMTDEWSLYTGTPYLSTGAQLAIRATRNGNVGIGTANPTERLSVNGTIRAREVRVESGPWPDYVFEDNYRLPDLVELEAYIKTNKHLPGIPDKHQVTSEGISLGEMNRLLLEKVEELTLHLIKKDRELLDYRTWVNGIEKRLQDLEISNKPN